MFKFLSRSLKETKKVLEQIDIIENQYQELIRDYADLVYQARKLKWRKIQIQKQVQNLQPKSRGEG